MWIGLREGTCGGFNLLVVDIRTAWRQSSSDGYGGSIGSIVRWVSSVRLWLIGGAIVMSATSRVSEERATGW